MSAKKTLAAKRSPRFRHGNRQAHLAGSETIISGMAGRYATALFELALDAKSIDAVGAGVANLEPGDRVLARTAPSAGGAFAEKLVIAASDVCRIPADMSFEQAAALRATE